MRRLGDIIEHAKKCGAFEFHGSIDSREADRWLKATEKAFNGAWFARVRMLQGNQLTWDVFKTEFCREYLTDAFKAERQNEFIALK